MIVFEILMSLMQVLLEFYLRFSNPFVALALLSFSVFVLMLPLYHLGDVLLAREKQIKARMQRELDSIAALSGGNRKYFYTQEIYRRYGYSPLRSLTGLLGLAVQIPFFFAAYHLLHDFTAFSGLAAGPFTDLSRPDALLQFSGLTIHLLPVIMTLINLLSAYYYAESATEKRKIWFFPALFLVLLYQQPVTLVFYWSMNNVFSLLKNLWHRRRLAIPELAWENLRRCWRSDVALGIHWGLFCLALFLSVLYFMYTDSDKEIPSLWINTVFLLLFYLGLYYRLLPDNSFRQGFKWRYCVRFLQTILLLVSFIMLWGLAWLGRKPPQLLDVQQLLELRQNVQVLRPITLLLELSVVVLGFAGRRVALLWPVGLPLLYWGWRKVPEWRQLQHSSKWRYLLALSCILVGICWTVPSRVVASDPALFEGNANVVGVGLLLFSLLFFLFFSLLYFVLPMILRFYISCFVAVGAWFFTANVLLFPGNYGAMEFTAFKKSLAIDNNAIAASALLFALLLLSLSALYLSWQKNGALQKLAKLDRVLVFFLILHAIFIGGNFYQVGYYWAQSQPQKVREENKKGNGNEAAPVRLSQNGRNIIILMLDKFMGGMVPEILRANPELAQMLDGFTFYPNAVSQAHQTYGGFPPIVGGSEYTVEKINQNDRLLATGIVEAFTMIPKALQEKFQKDGTNFTSYFVDVKYLLAPSARATLQQRFAALGVEELETSLDYSLLPDPQLVHSKVGTKLKWENFLVMLGIFQSFGPIFRARIYDDGRWMKALGDTSLWASIAFWEPYIQLLNLKNLIEPDNEQLGGSYVLLHNHLPHNTTFSDSYDYFGNQAHFAFTLPQIPDVLKQEDTKNGNKDLATLFLANYQTLYLITRWLEHLKEQSLYDNTVLYLTSDHGSRFFDPSFTVQGRKGFPLKSNWHSLYMYKGLAARGKLKISNEFRTMADIPAEFLPEFGITQNSYSGKTLEPVRSKPLSLYLVEGGPTNTEKKVGNDRQFFIQKQYDLHNYNIFDDANWEAVE